MSRLLIVILLMCIQVTANADFFEHHSQGWFWYEEPHQDEVRKKSTQKPGQVTKENATAIIKMIQKETESAKNLAILSPTPRNVANYLQQQKKLFSITDKFSSTWQQVLWANPDLGYAREIPVSAIGRQLHKEQQYKATKATLHQLSKRWGLLFFYRPTCLHCHKFAPILRRFVDEYGFELLALSPDGSSLPQMPDTKQDNGLLEKFGVTSLPQVIVMDAKTKKPVGRIQGMVTEDVLIEQLLSINNEVNREP